MNATAPSTPPQNRPGYTDLTVQQVHALKGKVRIIDVREKDELTGDLGHIEGVEHVPLATVEAAARGWPRDQVLVAVCRSSGRSGRAAAALVGMGFTHVHNMAGGMMAWNAAGFPSRRS